MRINCLVKLLTFFVLLGSFGCTWDQVEPQIDCSSSPIEIELLESTPAECGAAVGSFNIIASGGEQPFTYSFESNTNSDGVFTNIEAGNYTVIAKDAKGCIAEIDVSIQNEGGVNLEEVTVNEAGCGSSNGQVSINATGGEEPYLFRLDGGAPQASSSFTGLSNGTYSISVEDQLGCEVIEQVKILSGISFENSVKSIIATNCAISGCHNGSVSPNLSSFGNIRASASRIKSRTANRSMPRGRTLTQQQIDFIACWVDDGALQN